MDKSLEKQKSTRQQVIAKEVAANRSQSKYRNRVNTSIATGQFRVDNKYYPNRVNISIQPGQVRYEDISPEVIEANRKFTEKRRRAEKYLETKAMLDDFLGAE